MSFQCYWSTNPAYDTNERVFDFSSAIIRSRYHIGIIYNMLPQLLNNLDTINSQVHFSSPRSHTVEFNSFDLIKAVVELEKGFEELERLLLKMAVSPRYKLLMQYSKDGFNNLDYGEVV